LVLFRSWKTGAGISLLYSVESALLARVFRRKEGYRRTVRWIPIISREVPDGLSVRWSLPSLPVSCPFCERRTFSLLDLSFECPLITNIDIIEQ